MISNFITQITDSNLLHLFRDTLSPEDQTTLDFIQGVPVGVETKTEVKVRNLPKNVTKYTVHKNNLNNYPLEAFNKLSIKTANKKVYESYFECIYDLYQTLKQHKGAPKEP
jgi:hypothetical protein